jgi:hypothetical protein
MWTGRFQLSLDPFRCIRSSPKSKQYITDEQFLVSCPVLECQHALSYTSLAMKPDIVTTVTSSFKFPAWQMQFGNKWNVYIRLIVLITVVLSSTNLCELFGKEPCVCIIAFLGVSFLMSLISLYRGCFTRTSYLTYMRDILDYWINAANEGGLNMNSKWRIKLLYTELLLITVWRTVT